MERLKKNIIELTHCTLAEYREVKKLPLKVVADNVRSMYNIGAVFRTGDAFLIDEFILGGISGCPPHAEITKTALGAEESVKWRHVDDTLEEVKRLREEGWKIVVLEQTQGSVPLQYFKVMPGDKYALVIGNEVQGVDQRIVNLSDVALEIPQYGTKHSLNVSSSASIAMWHFFTSLIGK